MQSLRVATLNVWGKQGPWAARRVVLGRALAALEVDVIGLQEVLASDARRGPTGGGETMDQARELADELGLHATFGCALELGAGALFGNAILSRWPLADAETHPLPVPDGTEPRAMLSAMVRAPFGTVPFFCTHLSWRFDEGAVRMRQVLAIVAVIARRAAASEFPAVLVGDFNAEPDADEMRFLRGLHVHGGQSVYFIDAHAEAGQGPGATFSARNAFAAPLGEPDRRIDYVLVRGRDPRGWGRPRSCRLAFEEPAAPHENHPPVFASDHFGVVSELTVPGEEKSAIG